MSKNDESEVPSPTDFVLNWLKSNEEKLGSPISEIKAHVTDDPNRKGLGAEYETDFLLISILLWDHNFCIDIEVYDKETEKQLLFWNVADEGLRGLESKLEDLLNWLKKNNHPASPV